MIRNFKPNDDIILTMDKTKPVRKKTSKDALKEIELRQSLILKSVPMAVYAVNVNGDAGAMYISENIKIVTGFDCDMFMSNKKFWQSRIHPDDKEKVLNAVRLDSSKINFEIEYRWKCADDKYHWFLDRAVLIKDKTGKPKEIVGTWLDITERKMAEEALTQTNNELESALDEVNKLRKRLESENTYLKEEIKKEHNFEDIIGASSSLKDALDKVEKVAKTDATVLIRGETGTGKELIARSIHNLSTKSSSPLVKVNCPAIPAGLIESELFGHEKGAFTGALSKKIGKFELADGGTIMLDELGDLPLESQAKLLRVLQEKEFERVGGTKTISVNVRVIAATNRDLEEAVAEGKFRADLFYRMNVFPIVVPPLRERKDDIEPLAHHFMNRFSNKLGKDLTKIGSETAKKLKNYSWPGNIRELENIIERASILSTGNVLHVSENLFDTSKKIDLPGNKSPKLEDIEREHIINILETTSWQVHGERGAAKVLGMNPSTLRTRMTKLGIKKKTVPFSS